MNFDKNLVIMYVCLNVKVLKSEYMFSTEVSDSIKNCMSHGETQKY